MAVSVKIWKIQKIEAAGLGGQDDSRITLDWFDKVDAILANVPGASHSTQLAELEYTERARAQRDALYETLGKQLVDDDLRKIQENPEEAGFALTFQEWHEAMADMVTADNTGANVIARRRRQYLQQPGTQDRCLYGEVCLVYWSIRHTSR